MQIAVAYGNTRFVILWREYAIKIARFRLIRLAARFLLFFISTRGRKRLRRYDERLAVALGKYFLEGVLANRNEYRLYVRSQDDVRLVPTLYSLCFGLVNIQRRGRPVGAIAFKELHPFRYSSIPENLASEMSNPEQFCLIGGRVCLADAGNPLIARLIAPQ